MNEEPEGMLSDDARRSHVRELYGSIATQGSSGGCNSREGSSCCGEGGRTSCCGDTSVAIDLGYSSAQLAALPKGADLGLGCGNPTAILGLKSGQSVLDLGSGAGIDCFLAAKRVGAKGSVIGVDMTPEMVAKARENARKGTYANVDFRLGEIEHLPVADDSIDTVISNCVINLAPDKKSVYQEAFRVLRPGGHLAISDVVATRSIAAKDRADPSLWSSCTSGAVEVSKLKALLRRLGFVDIDVKVQPRRLGFADVEVKVQSSEKVAGSRKGRASLGVVAADIIATKPDR
ncbi:MAG: arsenite methyltransferase [Thermoplasmata archaeon]